MTAEQIAFHVSYASVESATGTDPTEDAVRILRDERVLAASRRFDGDETIVLIPVTENGAVVALADDGRLRFDLSTMRLQELFAAAGLTLHLGLPDDALDDVDAELDEEFGEAFEELDDPRAPSHDLGGFGLADGDDDAGFTLEPVRVVEFSHRGPWAARLTAQLTGAEVDYTEAGQWSACRYATGRAHAAVSQDSAELPIIEVNMPAHGEAWIEVTAPGDRTGMFWPNLERLTRPVLDLETIAVPESADVYRRMLQEADGVREELEGLGLGSALDVDAAHRACTAEAVGGTPGAIERIHAFVAAFGVPASLVSTAVGDQASGHRFAPRGWPRTIGDFLVAGLGDAIPLTRRDRPVARLVRFLGARPLLGAALSTGELAAGIAAARSRSRPLRAVGVLLVIDAIADLVIWIRRIGRR